MKLGLKVVLRIILSCFIIIPALVIMLVGMVSIFSFSGQTQSEEAEAFGNSLSGGIDRLFDEYAGNVTAMSKLDYVVTAANGQYSSVEVDVKKLIDNTIKSGASVVDLVITDKEGIVMADVSGISQNAHFYGYDDDSLKSIGKSDVYFSTITQQSAYDNAWVFYAARQVRDGDNTAGYIIEVISTDAICNYAQKCAFLAYGNMLVVDPNGTTVNFNSMPVTQLQDINDSSLNSAISSIKGVKNATNKNESLKANGYYGCYNSINDTAWLWVATYPSSSTTTAVIIPFLIGIVVVIAAALIEVLIMISQTRKIINPMTDMIAKMKLIKNGDKNERFEVTGKNEFAKMADTFNSMIDEVVLSEELHRTISDISDNMLFEWDFTKERMYISDNFKNKFDIDNDAATLLNGKFIDSLMEQSIAEQYKRDINQLLKTKDNFGGEYEVRGKNGTMIWISMRAQCMTDRLGEPLRVIGVITDIDNEKKLNLQLAERASYDFLSQLYNRSTFERELQAELERHANSKVGVLFLDVDDFKFINDRYGHSVGDEVIKYVSSIIKNRVKDCGFAGRFGGDEFVMCITDPKLIDNVEILAMDIIDELYNGYEAKSVNAILNVKASIGVAISPEHGNESTKIIGASDEAMYFVKKNGKANYHIYDPEDSKHMVMLHSM